MLTFGVIAEGPTDQQVIENILLGYFQDEEEGIDVRPIQPPPSPSSPGGWSLVFKCLERGDAEQALQFNDFLVIQIDTDVQEETGFDVPKREGGVELPLGERVERVIARLKRHMDSPPGPTDMPRILFAVAVDSIECWLLPLLLDGRKAAKTTGCLKTADAELRRKRRKGLSSKSPAAYDEASRGYAKRKTLMDLRDRNPSLELFIEQLDALRARLDANRNAPSREQIDASPDGETATDERPE